MKNDIKLPEGFDSKPFYSHFNKYLSNNLGEQLIFPISNLLAIDYSLRLKSALPIEEYVALCGARLKKYLDHKVILDETFSSVMTLFTIAITPENQEDNEDKDKSAKQSQDAVIESVILTHFSDLNSAEQQTIRMIIKDLLNGKDGKELISIIVSDPQLFESIALSAIKTQKKQHELSESVRTHLTSVLTQSKTLNQKVNIFKSAFAKIALAGSMVAAASIGIIVGGFALPALIVPATLYAIKYSPTIGEKIGNIVAQNVPTIVNETKNLNQLKTTNKQVAIHSPNLSNSIQNELSPEKAKELAKTLELKAIAIDKDNDLTAVERTSEQKSKSKKQGRMI